MSASGNGPVEDALKPDWAAIRLDWERSGSSDVAIAKAWGFKSPTSIERRRKKEGWTRTLSVASDLVVAEVVRRDIDVGGVGDTHTNHITAPTPLESESSHLAGPTRLGVGGETRISPVDAPNFASPHMDLAAAHKTAFELRVEAAARHTAMAQGMVDTVNRFNKLLRDLTSEDITVAMAAANTLARLNPDKETGKGIIAAVAQLSIAAVKVERQALGMDLKADDAAAGQPTGAVPLAALLDLIDDVGLVETTREATIQMRMRMLQEPARPPRPPPPTIDHSASEGAP